MYFKLKVVSPALSDVLESLNTKTCGGTSTALYPTFCNPRKNNGVGFMMEYLKAFQVINSIRNDKLDDKKVQSLSYAYYSSFASGFTLADVKNAYATAIVDLIK